MFNIRLIANRKLSLVRKGNLRIRIYLLIFLGLILYLAIYLDSIRFYNFKKTIFSIRSPVELADYEVIKKYITPENEFKSKLEIISGKPYLRLPGFEKELLNKSNTKIRKRNATHPTLNLALFCMGYASDYLVKHVQDSSFSLQDLEIIENVYMYVYKEIINPFSLNNMSINDHAVSSRIQFLALFSTYVEKYFPEKRKLVRHLRRDINICLGFLMDKKSFTWQTNHGIMQIKALALTADIIKNENLKSSILTIIEKRLSDIIPFHLGPDGAIYEAASGYWLLIYDAFLKITSINSVKNLKSVALLKEELRKCKHFYNTVTTNDGFLQGLGDSYSVYDLKISESVSLNRNRYFRFSNEIIGANWTNGAMNHGVLFVSLHTPPNAHKLPEDLAVYVYLNHPIFSNTGAYSYGMIYERLFFQTEDSQSTVSFLDQKFEEPKSSNLALIEFNSDDNTLTATGYKKYECHDTIIRFLRIDPEKGIYIKDSASETNAMVSYYNVHPKITIKRISNSEILLGTVDSMFLSFFSNNSVEIVDGVISNKWQELTKIKRLKISGNPIEVQLKWPTMELDNNMEMIFSEVNANNRFISASKLKTLYRNNNNIRVMESVYGKVKIILIAIFLFVSTIELLYFVRNRKDEK